MARSLTIAEQEQVLSVLTNNRDRAIFLVGLKCGYRISEILSLQIKDVWANGCVLDRVKVRRTNMKGSKASRDCVLHPVAKAAIEALVLQLKNEPEAPLFQSREGGKALSRFQAAKILRDATAMAKIQPTGGTHMLRKSFASAIYKRSGNDLLLTQKSLGHSSVITTILYLQTDKAALDAAVLAS